MSLPKKVREAEEKAEALYKQLYEQNQAAAPTEEPAPEQPSAETTEPPAQEEPPQEPVGSQEPAAPTDTEGDAEDTWEHRFKVLTGKYSAEVPRLAADNRELRSTLKQMEQQLEDLKKGKSTGQTYVKPEEVEEYGEPLIDLIRRAAREEVAAKEAEIEALKVKIESFDSRTSKVVEVDFYEQLGRDVPDWVAINDDKNFHKWLDQYDELTGQRRQDMLAAAESDKDARRVANFFKAYKKAGQSWAATASKKLESQVVPETNQSVKPQPGKKIWSRGEIANFYAAMRRGDVSDKEAVAIEAEIHAAQVEGRVR